MQANKTIIIFLLGYALCYCLSGGAVYAGRKDAAAEPDSAQAHAATGNDAYVKNEFLDTVLKKDSISFFFLHEHTLMRGYFPADSIRDKLRAAGAQEDPAYEAGCMCAQDYFKGDTVYRINKRFAMAEVMYGDNGLAEHKLLFIIDLVTNKNTDWIIASEHGLFDDTAGSGRKFELKNDTVVIIDYTFAPGTDGPFSQIITDGEQHVLHINKAGKFVGERPESN